MKNITIRTYCTRIVFVITFSFSLLESYQVNGQQIITDDITIGSKRQLFTDNYLIQKISGEARVELHNPEPREIVLTHDAPWEGNASVYHSIFKDGDIYRMYYRGTQINIDSAANKVVYPNPTLFCYAESRDGINWIKPKLGIVEFKGSKENNIILANSLFSESKFAFNDNASFFRDENPNAPASERYKAFVMSNKSPAGLMAFKSADAIHWLPMHDKAVITDGAFDSQNLGFWDPEIGKYRAYWRYFRSFTTKDDKSPHSGIRAIRTATSNDFIHWEHQTDLSYESSPNEDLYTNQILPYYRATQILVGFPNRYIEREWSPSMNALPEVKHRQLRSQISMRYGTGLTDALFMSSRNGKVFNRWNEAFFKAGIERPGTWNYGQHYVAWGIVETKSSMIGAPNELSFYSVENYWTGTSNELRRYTLRIDGFASLSAPMKGGEVITKPFKFDGKKLSVNFATSIAGSIRIELQDVNGNAIPGFSLEECAELYGDTLEREVSWKGGTVPGDLLDRHVKLRIVLKDAELYSFKFY